MSRSFLDSVPAVSESDLVKVRLENLFLVVVPLHFARRALLSQLASETRIASINLIRMHVPDELLRDRARAAPVTEDVVLDRAGDADYVNAVVLVETLVFDSDKRLADVLRERPNRDAAPDLGTHLANQRPIASENL